MPKIRHIKFLNRLHTNCIKHSNTWLLKTHGEIYDRENEELNEEYCELEEKYKEAKSKVKKFLEGHKYIPKTREGQKFTNGIRTLYYRLLAEWNPDLDTHKALAKIQLTNDLCEGILGLND